jgi:methionyl-tRNA formyltransferase
MKFIVCCNSDHLALPTLLTLAKEDLLEMICIPSKSVNDLKPYFESFIPNIPIQVVEQTSLHDQLTHLNGESTALLLLTFPWYLNEETCKHFAYGAYNLHYSLLPKYAGKDPLFWQLIHETKSGFTIHSVTPEIDGGPIVFQKETPIIPGEHYGLFAQRLGQFAASTINEWIEVIHNNQKRAASPPDKTYWNSPTESELRINWNESTAEEIQKLVAAANPKYGGAVFELNGESMKLLEAMLVQVNEINSFKPGTIVFADELHGVIVKCKHGSYLKLTIINSSIGYTSGLKLFQIGIRSGIVLN